MLSIEQLRQFQGTGATGAISISQQNRAEGGATIRQRGFLHAIKTFFGFESAKAENRETVEAIRQAIHNDPQLFLGHRKADELLNKVKGTITMEEVGNILTAVRTHVDGMTSRAKNISVKEVITARIESRPVSAWPKWAQKGLDEKLLPEWAHFVATSALSRPEPEGGWGTLDISAAIKEVEDTLEAAFAEVPDNPDVLAKLVLDRGITLLSNAGKLKPKDECVALAKQVQSLVETARGAFGTRGGSEQAIVRHVALKNISQMKVLMSPSLFSHLAKLGLQLDPNPLSDIHSGMSLAEVKKTVKKFKETVEQKMLAAATDEMNDVMTGKGTGAPGGEAVFELQSLVMEMAVAGMDPVEQEDLRLALNDSKITDFMDKGVDDPEEQKITDQADPNERLAREIANAHLGTTMNLIDHTLDAIGLHRNFEGS